MKRVVGVLLLVSACSSNEPQETVSNVTRSDTQARRVDEAANTISAANTTVANGVAAPEKIGVARMDKNGTITLMLRTEVRRSIWEAQYTYRRTDKNYREQLEEIGPLKPGESKEVFARPEETSDSETSLPPSR